MRIAMWSGPRNLSTAMMYSFGNRADFAAWDEPFYAPYLDVSGVEHPMGAEIKTAHECDPAKVAAQCIGPVPDQKPNYYMKHMPHHMIDGIPIDWAQGCINVHLIRHPARVISSYGKKRASISMEDIGFQQQLDLYRQIGGIVIDSADIRENPEDMLNLLCDVIGIDFDPAMLSWPAGAKSFDGVWASHWYDAVHKSTGFAAAEGPIPDVPDHQELLSECLPFYETMASDKI